MSRKWIKRLCMGLFLLFMILAAWFALQLVFTKREYGRGERDIRSVYELREELQPDGVVPGEVLRAMDEASARAAEIENSRLTKESYQKLKKWNQDLIGWVKIDGTAIDYPVMQTPEDPNYYLHRGFDKEYSVYGMIYLDARCSLYENCPNYLLYGHHMKNGSMFAELEEYASEDYWREHPMIQFDTLEETGSYRVMAVLRLDADTLSPDFTTMLAARTKEDYGSLMNYISGNQLYDTGMAAEWPQQLITLTTCEYSHENGRLLVFAVRESGGV